jgi:hypothetical protein
MMDGRRRRPFKSLCQSRYFCRQCNCVVYTRALGRAGHQCRRQQQQIAEVPQNDQNLENVPVPNVAIPVCPACKGPHLPEQPCYIQPLGPESRNVLNNRKRRNTIGNAATATPPLHTRADSPAEHGENQMEEGLEQQQQQQQQFDKIRYFAFDIECSQEEEMVGKPGVYKHRPILVCAEIICTVCISAGVRIGHVDSPARPPGCCCNDSPRLNWRARRWLVPNTDGRRFQFHSFDDANIDPVGEMLSYLTNHGPKTVPTIALSHNGLFFSLFISWTRNTIRKINLLGFLCVKLSDFILINFQKSK